MTRSNVKRESIVADADARGSTKLENSYEMLSPPPGSSFQSAQSSQSSMPRKMSGMSLETGEINRSRNFRTNSLEVPRQHTPESSDEGGIQIMGRHIQVLQDMIARFEKLGINLDVPLPKLVVVGDQSAGKSSVIGALAEIDLPRNSGTCTRCPYFIQTKGTGDVNAGWSCKVTLLRKYEFVPGQKVSRQNPLGPWKKLNDPVVDAFQVINEKADLATTIAWAQVAVLNPEIDPAAYVPGIGSEFIAGNMGFSTPFSPNIVSMEITGPGLPALSFYDLPGIINVADERDLVRVVRNLIREYIVSTDALVLCALPMGSDPATSSAVSFVRDTRAQDRGIGVITKPDRLQAQEFSSDWLSILNGEDRGYKMAHGWFVVKNPSSNDMVVDHVEARLAETQFFENTYPWDAVTEQYGDKFGTHRLREAVSQKLTVQIKLALPKISEAISKREASIQAQLQKLPAPPGDDVFPMVIKYLSSFSTKVATQIDGSEASKFGREWRNLYEKFGEAIIAMLPRIRASDGIDMSRSSSTRPSPFAGDAVGVPFRTPSKCKANEPIPVDSDDEPAATPTLLRQSGKRFLKEETPTATPSKKSMLVPGMSSRRLNPDSHDTPFAKHLNNRETYSLSEIREITKRFSTTHLPDIHSTKALEHLCERSIRPWEGPLDTFVERLIFELRTLVFKEFEAIFKQYTYTPLYRLGANHLNEFLARAESELKQATSQVYFVEAHSIMTYNRDGYKDHSDRQFIGIAKVRRELRVKSYLQQMEERTGKSLGDEVARRTKAEKVTDEELNTAFGPDNFLGEMKVASHARGYYMLAAYHFVDSICKTVMAVFFKNTAEKIHGYLETELRLFTQDGHERCRTLMEPDSNISATRAALKRELAKVHEAMNELATVDQEMADPDQMMVDEEDETLYDV